MTVNGEAVAVTFSGGRWQLTAPFAPNIKADGRFININVALPSDAAYLTLINANGSVNDGRNFAVVIVARDQRLDDAPHLFRADPLEDRRAALLPSLDTVDVVAAQPVLVDPA